MGRWQVWEARYGPIQQRLAIRSSSAAACREVHMGHVYRRQALEAKGADLKEDANAQLSFD